MATMNGDTIVFCNQYISIDGQTDIDIEGYIDDISYTTGPQSAHVQAQNPLASPISINPINSSPSGTITFSPGKFASFYKMMNNRFTKFSLTISYYVTGNIGETQGIFFPIVMWNDNTGNSRSNSPQNTMTISFNATQVVYL